MAKTKAVSNRDKPIVKGDLDCEVTLPDWIRTDVRMLRWLHHRVVDLLACHDHTDWMIQDIEDRLGALSFDMVDDAVNDLIVEIRIQGKEVTRG